jgi:hypothetical protein
MAQIVAFRAASTPTPPPAPVKYVQGAYQVPLSPQTTVAVSYPAAQTAGNLSVVIVGWNDSVNSVSSVTNSRGQHIQASDRPCPIRFFEPIHLLREQYCRRRLTR